MTGKLFLICAPSGAGKTTLVQKALEVLQDIPLYKVCTYTTKPIGIGEVQGKDYYFLSVSEFEQKIEAGFFLEWSREYEHYYGSPLSIKEGLQKGDSFFMIVDKTGIRSIKHIIPECLPIWVHVSSIDLLKKRLLGRARENNACIQRRLQKAVAEMAEEAQNPLCIKHIDNNELDLAVQDLADFIRLNLKK
jgi:guanylate kinase